LFVDKEYEINIMGVFLIGFSAYLAFVLDYLPAQSLQASNRKLIRLGLFIVLSAGILSFLLELPDKSKVAFIMLFGMTLFLLAILVLWCYILVGVSSWGAMKKGYKPAIFLFIGNTIMISSIIAVFVSMMINPLNSNMERNPWFVLGLIFDALIFSFGITSRIRQLQKEREADQRRSIELLESRVQERTLELSMKNGELENKNREITDSILYAQRLQNSMLPTLSSIVNVLEKFVFLYLPKDIVAGDFYWFHADDKGWILAICDCTGHGVPGAMVSMVCSDALKAAVLEENLRDPGKILDFTAVKVHEHFSSDDAVTDGMDAGILCFDNTSDSFLWSGANQPLLLINQDSSYSEIKPDKYSIGNPPRDIAFTTHHFKKLKGQSLLMSTDGYPDQFNHAGNKKLTRRKFYELLASHAAEGHEELNRTLRSFHYNFRGDETQTDDILVAGVFN
ncbi:MAG: hypothetical protein RLZZ46_444, partial [Bacteroidota bacterium]